MRIKSLQPEPCPKVPEGPCDELNLIGKSMGEKQKHDSSEKKTHSTERCSDLKACIYVVQFTTALKMLSISLML